jgi:hypothetical protein
MTGPVWFAGGLGPVAAALLALLGPARLVAAADAAAADVAAADAVDGGSGEAGAEHSRDAGGAGGGDGAGPIDGLGAIVAPAPPSPPPPRARYRGQVLEKGTRRPLGGVTVRLDLVVAAETDAAGRFAIEAAPGAHDLLIESSGHEVTGRRVELAGAVGATEAGVEEVFRLVPRDTGERYGAVVRSGRPELAQVNMDAGEARATAGSSGDPLRVLGSLPGVSQVVWPAAVYVVRGSNPGNTGFFLDGAKVPALFHLALGPSVIHPYFLEGLDFYPGGGPAAFGGYTGGMVAARTAAPPADRVRGSADVTVYDAGGIATAPIAGGRGTVAAAARYSYAGLLLSVVSPGTTLRYGDYQLRVDRAFGGGRATLFAYGAVDDIGWSDLGQRTEYASLQFHRIDARWRGAVAGGRLVAAAVFGLDRARSTLWNTPIKVVALSAAPRLAFERDLGTALTLQLGTDAQLQRFDAEVPPFGQALSDLASSRNAVVLAAHGTAIVRAGTRLVISPGFRGDLFAEERTRRFAAQPRLDLSFDLSPRFGLKAGGGRFAQMASLPASVPGFESFGLASLGVQTALGGAAGAEARLPDIATVSLSGFYQRLRLTDIRSIDVNMPDPAGLGFLVARDGLSYGAELMVRRSDQNRFHGWLAYTLSWSLRADENGVIGRSDWDQRHILNLVSGFRLGRGYTAGARFHYHTGRNAPIFATSGGAYRQLPAFYQLDLRAQRRFHFDRFVLDVFIDLGNVTLSRQTVQLTSVPFPDGPRVVEQGFRIILPTVGVHGEI